MSIIAIIRNLIIFEDYDRTKLDDSKPNFSPGDNRRDPNCPMVHQYYPELNTASQPTRLPKQLSLSGVVHGRSSKIRLYIQQVFEGL